MNKIEEISQNIVDKVEYNNGVMSILDSEYYNQKYRDIREMSVWKFSNMLANFGYSAVAEVLGRLRFLIHNNNFSSEEMAEVMDSIRGKLSEKAKETNREVIQ